MNVDNIFARCAKLAFRKCVWPEHFSLTVQLITSRLNPIKHLLTLSIRTYAALEIAPRGESYTDMIVFETLPNVVTLMLSWPECGGLVRSEDRGNLHMVKLFGRKQSVTYTMINPDGPVSDWLSDFAGGGGGNIHETGDEMEQIKTVISHTSQVYHQYLEGRANTLREHLGSDAGRLTVLTSILKHHYMCMANIVNRLYEDQEDDLKFNMVQIDTGRLEEDHKSIIFVAPYYDVARPDVYRHGCVIQKVSTNFYIILFEDGSFYGSTCPAECHHPLLMDGMLGALYDLLTTYRRPHADV